MNIVELIGFVITMIALGMLSHKQKKEAKRRAQEEPDEYNEERLKHDPAVQQLLRSLNIDIPPEKPSRKKEQYFEDEEEEEEAEPTPPIPTISKNIPVRQMRRHEFKNAYRQKMHATIIKGEILKKISLKEAMILHVILGPPKGQ